jgi:hypothetical protein
VTDQEQLAEEPALNRWQRHRFMVLIGLTIVIALFLVSVALALYASSGAAQLDLSRPGYESVRERAAKSDTFENFPATGPIDKETLDQFRRLYDAQAKKATNIDSFGGDVMNDQTLLLDNPAEQPAQ